MSFALDEITAQNSSSYDLFSELITDLSSYWHGHQIDLKDAITLNEHLKDKIFRFALSQPPNSHAVEHLLGQFVQIENHSPYSTLTCRDITPLFATFEEQQLRDNLITHIGLGKFWKKHKKEIIIGVIATAIVVTVIAISIATSGAGSPAAAAAGAAAAGGAKKHPNDSPKKKAPTPTKNTNDNQETTSNSAQAPTLDPPINKLLSYNQPLFLEDGVIVKDKYYTYWDFLQKTKQEEFLAHLLNTPNSSPPSESTYHQGIPPQSGISLTRKFFETFGREVLGQEFMADVPPSKVQESHLFTVPGKRSSSYRIGGINGIGNSLDDAISHADYIQQFAPEQSLDWVYNNSHGALADLFLEAPLNYGGISPNTSKLLTDNWVDFHKENKDNPKAKYLQLCHSQGAIHVRNALDRAPQEIRDRIIVVAIAPATIIPKKLCFRSTNYASKRDIVPLGEMLFAGFNESETRKEELQTALEHRKELILLDPHPDAKGMDHNFQSPTFKEIITGHIADYIKYKGNHE